MAKQIQRAPSEHFSPRPFQRISWNLFLFSQTLDNLLYTLILKDEYSGKLFATCLTTKTLQAVSSVLRNFDTWVQRQYRLKVCKIGQDAEAAVVSAFGEV